jgi:hypothetical protein
MSVEETDAASRAIAKNDNRISLAFIESQIDTKSFTTGLDALGRATVEYAPDNTQDRTLAARTSTCHDDLRPHHAQRLRGDRQIRATRSGELQ